MIVKLVDGDGSHGAKRRDDKPVPYRSYGAVYQGVGGVTITLGLASESRQ